MSTKIQISKELFLEKANPEKSLFLYSELNNKGRYSLILHDINHFLKNFGYPIPDHLLKPAPGDTAYVPCNRDVTITRLSFHAKAHIITEQIIRHAKDLLIWEDTKLKLDTLIIVQQSNIKVLLNLSNTVIKVTSMAFSWEEILPRYIDKGVFTQEEFVKIKEAMEFIDARK